jgi:hypothetical protein
LTPFCKIIIWLNVSKFGGNVQALYFEQQLAGAAAAEGKGVKIGKIWGFFVNQIRM